MTLSSKLIEKLGRNPHPSSRAFEAHVAGGVQMTSELARVLALPRRTYATVADLTMVYLRHFDDEGKVRCIGCHVCRGTKLVGPSLWPIQSQMLWEASEQNGLFAPVAVGAGKTLTTLLLPDAMNSERAVLFVKPSLRAQLWNVDIPAYGRHFKIAACHEYKGPQRKFENGLYIVAYSELSSSKKADLLDQIAPDLIISDEAHNFRHRTAARTKRFLRYMKDHPECRFAALSGTMTTRSIKDYAHLVELALKKNSPLPAPWPQLQDWAAALDDVPEPMPPGKLMLFCEQGESVRSGYRRRLVETPGVVATSESALGTSLVIASRPLKLTTIISVALEKLRRTWAWDGEEFEDAMALYRVARQLACGFFYRWNWPGGKADAEWLRARKDWHVEVRDYLRRRAKPGMDSPLLLAQAAAQGRWDSVAWPEWAKVKDRPPPPVIPVWLDEFMVKDVAGWALEVALENSKDDTVGGIVWYEHDAVGRRLEGMGLPLFGPGEEAARALDSVSPKKHPVIVCSIKAHGTGRNLQAYSKMLVTTPPANGAVWEQLLGRCHRPGQQADEVEVWTYFHTDELASAFDRALKDAVYIEATQGQRQKLLMASIVRPTC